MKNLIFVALLVSVMLVLSVGSVFAYEGEVDDPTQERQATTAGGGGGFESVAEVDEGPDFESSAEAEAEVGGESGASGGEINSLSELVELLFPTIDEYNERKDVTID